MHEKDDLSNVKTYASDAAAADGCVEELRRTIGTYKKNKLDGSRYTHDAVSAAVTRSEAKDSGSDWPQEVGTHVHRVIKSIGLREPG